MMMALWLYSTNYTIYVSILQGPFGLFLVAINCHLWHHVTMKFTDPLTIVGDEPVFEAGLLLASDVHPADVRRQLSRWVRAGRLCQLRRGLPY